MNSTEIEKNVHDLIRSYDKDQFIYDLLLAYGKPKSTIELLKKGNLNLSKTDGIVLWKKELYFQIIKDVDLHLAIDTLEKDQSVLKHHPRFIIVTDHKTILSVDTKTNDKLDVELNRLDKFFDFFLPWSGLEKSNLHNENPADLKAATKMAKLFDEIKKDNNVKSDLEIHSLNMFMCRMLFCFFAEDTNIFEDDIFTNGINSHTQPDGSDLDQYLEKLFEVLNTEDKKRNNIPNYLAVFPYVNGGLFKDTYKAPKFTKHSRKIIIECGTLDWADINPDIFGSMIQSITSSEDRSTLGMHYTSVENIMKLIKPLFLDELYDGLEKANGDKNKLQQILKRLENIKIFDPACGSGNFLIIAYKELRRFEMKVMEELDMESLSVISLDQFYGIEIEDLACEMAILSLWFSKQQMSIEFKNKFGKAKPALPLKETGNIIHGNACRLDWDKVCPNDNMEIFIIGNPPYKGARGQKKLQKEDTKKVLSKIDGYNNLDYISCWIYKASFKCKSKKVSAGFVTTNSICQGMQVPILWQEIIKNDIEISFAYEEFQWSNNAKYNAGVVCVIIGLSKKSTRTKYIYSKDSTVKAVKNISPYLIDSENVIIQSRKKPLSFFPKMVFGSMPNDNGYLILNDNEKNNLINKFPQSKTLIRKLVGSNEFINGLKRWCLWINEDNIKKAESIEEINERINLVKSSRISSKRKATNKLSLSPHKFGEIRHEVGNSIIVPSVSSHLREYIPIGFLDQNSIISNLALAIYNPDPYMMSILRSKIHMVWVRNIGGHLGSGLRYSVTICYNTFPFPYISENKKQELTNYAFKLIEEREKHSDKTLAELYDPDKMPEGLKDAHNQNDLAVERCYQDKPFESDAERLKCLFNLYEKMINEEQDGLTLF